MLCGRSGMVDHVFLFSDDTSTVPRIEEYDQSTEVMKSHTKESIQSQLHPLPRSHFDPLTRPRLRRHLRPQLITQPMPILRLVRIHRPALRRVQKRNHQLVAILISFRIDAGQCLGGFDSRVEVIPVHGEVEVVGGLAVEGWGDG